MIKKINRATLRKAYRDALAQVFGCGDKTLDKDLLSSLKKDVHLGGRDPGEYGTHALLSIYCESGIPNASDIHDLRDFAREFGCDPSQAVVYNDERWSTVDDIVNLYLSALNIPSRVYHEPVNNAVVNIYAS